MSLSSIITEALGNVNWLQEAEKGVTITESLAPLLIKTATDAYNAAKGNGSLLTVIQDIESDLPAAEAAFTANNTQVVPAPTTAEVETPPGAVG